MFSFCTESRLDNLSLKTLRKGQNTQINVLQTSGSNGSKNQKRYFFNQNFWSGRGPRPPHPCCGAIHPKLFLVVAPNLKLKFWQNKCMARGEKCTPSPYCYNKRRRTDGRNEAKATQDYCLFNIYYVS